MALARFRLEADGVIVEGEGVVTIQGAPSPDDTVAIVAFLRSIDVETVEKAAMERMAWGSDPNITANVIAWLIEQLTGQPS